MSNSADTIDMLASYCPQDGGPVDAAQWTTLAEIAPDFAAPKTVDLNVNGVCNLNCAWCWGPAHEKSLETVTGDEWVGVMGDLRAVGTENIVFTGGETLMKKELPMLVRAAKELGFRNTLSTNGILLPARHAGVLPFINDVGLPLDGADRETNDSMRRPLGNRSPHFKKVLESIKLVQTIYPDIELTVRTVVGRPNVDSVHRIGGLLINSGIDPTALRWKLYQCNPIGPRQDQTIAGDWLISGDEFDQTMERVHDQNPLFPHIQGQKVKDSIGRYFHIHPDGETNVVVESDRWTSEGTPVNSETATGNIVRDFPGTMHSLWANGFRAVRLNRELASAVSA